MLDATDLVEVVTAFGVAEDQVRRDHLISHILRATAELGAQLVFFGGTALARTHLSDPLEGGRLSEDVDLFTADRRRVAALLQDQLPDRLRREFPGCTWTVSPMRVKAVDPAQLTTTDGLRVRIQLLNAAEHRELTAWPLELRRIEMRYRDVTATSLTVPTLTAFAAMKTTAWMDRRAARDLYDLALLATKGALSADTAALVRHVTSWQVAPHFFAAVPPFDWEAELAHQTRELPDAQRCLTTVRRAYGEALGWSRP